jgi:hypothetical protein
MGAEDPRRRENRAPKFAAWDVCARIPNRPEFVAPAFTLAFWNRAHARPKAGAT